MFREMRRKRQLLPQEESVAILEKMTNGTLALHGDNAILMPFLSVMFMLMAKSIFIAPR